LAAEIPNQFIQRGSELSKLPKIKILTPKKDWLDFLWQVAIKCRDVMKLRGVNIYDKLYECKNKAEKINLFDVENFLLKEIAEHNEGLVNWYQSKDYKTKSVINKYNKLFAILKS
jgi:hypothetical protein